MRLYWLLLLGLSVTLSACKGTESTPTSDLPQAHAGRSGLRVSLILLDHGQELSQNAAEAGSLSSVFMSEQERGIVPIPPSALDLRPRQSTTETDAELIERGIYHLRIDMQQLLNRSTDRSTALQAYETTLESLVSDSREHLAILRDEEDRFKDEERRLKRVVRDLAKDVQKSIRGDYERDAAIIITELTESQASLIEASASLARAELFIGSYKEILEPLEDRLFALKANRDALLEGIRVQDVRGIEDLGVLERGKRETGRRR
jgi:hypothetical protein